MKRIISFLAIAMFLGACKKDGGFLENQDVSSITEQMVFTDSVRSIGFLTRIYNDIGFSFNKGRWDSHGNLEQATDEAEYRYSGGTQKAVMLYAGTISPGNVVDDFWSTPWANIRRVNLLLQKMPQIPLSQPRKNLMVAEARFLRAWYYEYLLKSFGGVPIIGDVVFGINDIINLKRNTYEECVNYLVKELDESAAALPATRADEDYGRITKGACLALKARILLYAASPLFNGGSIATNPELAEIVSYPSASVARWETALQAAEAVINLKDEFGAPKYALYEDNTTAPGYGFYRMFLMRVNPEYIFARLQGGNRTFEGHYLPSTRGGAFNSHATQNMVDAFPMKNGKPITDPTSGYSETNPYVGRDPRFAYTIIYNGAPFYLSTSNSKQPMNLYYQRNANGTLTPQADVTSTTTGYYVRKMLDDNSNSNTERGWPLIRFAEIILGYAEALNEVGRTEDAVTQIKLIRKRAGIDAGTDSRYGIPAGISQADMQSLIRNERRIELAYEDHRFFDVRRWKIAQQTDNGFNRGMQVIKELNNTFTYTPTVSIRKHNFRPEMYLLPIPQGEVSKMPAMVQNPGW